MKKIKWVVMAFAILQAFVVHNAVSQTTYAPPTSVVAAVNKSGGYSNVATVSFTPPATNPGTTYYKIVSLPGNRARLVSSTGAGTGGYKSTSGVITVSFGVKTGPGLGPTGGSAGWDFTTMLAGSVSHTFYVAPADNKGNVLSATSTASNAVTTPAVLPGHYIVALDSSGNYSNTPDFLVADAGVAGAPYTLPKTSGRYLIFSHLTCHKGPAAVGTYMLNGVFTLNSCNGRTDWDLPTWSYLDSLKKLWNDTNNYAFSNFGGGYKPSYTGTGSGCQYKARSFAVGTQDIGYAPCVPPEVTTYPMSCSQTSSTTSSCVNINLAIGQMRASQSTTGAP